jgi:hypothetical protein
MRAKWLTRTLSRATYTMHSAIIELARDENSFVSCPNEQAALYIGALKEVKLGDEIFETKEVKAEVEAAKRRGRFRLSMVGIRPGTELHLAKDPTIISPP